MKRSFLTKQLQSIKMQVDSLLEENMHSIEPEVGLADKAKEEVYVAWNRLVSIFEKDKNIPKITPEEFFSMPKPLSWSDNIFIEFMRKNWNAFSIETKNVIRALKEHMKVVDDKKYHIIANLENEVKRKSERILQLVNKGILERQAREDLRLQKFLHVLILGVIMLAVINLYSYFSIDLSSDMLIRIFQTFKRSISESVKKIKDLASEFSRAILDDFEIRKGAKKILHMIWEIFVAPFRLVKDLIINHFHNFAAILSFLSICIVAAMILLRDQFEII